jgi:hypothetical protein
MVSQNALLLVFVLLVFWASWLFRFAIYPQEGKYFRLDRWTGEVLLITPGMEDIRFGKMRFDGK